MAGILNQTGRFALMILFLCGSAYCSGTETAFFSLSRRQVNILRGSKHRLQRLVAYLLDQPSALLGSLLLGNLIVNTLFFATSSVLMLQVREQTGLSWTAVIGFVTFLCLVLFGEILPKTISYANPERFSVLAVLPTVVLVRVLSPLVMIFRWLIAEPVLRLLLGSRRGLRTVTHDEFKALIEATCQRGLITAQQGRLFAEVIDFHLLKVRHVMRPRVDMVVCEVTAAVHEARDLMLHHNVTTLYVYQETLDNVVGEVEFRDLLLQTQGTLSSMIRPIQYVPEQKTVESLLQFFRKMRTDTAVVVDEYGGVAGSVSIEDVAEALFGPLQYQDAAEAIEQVGPFQYRLPGSLPIHDWIKAFGVHPAHADIATVGGWITALLGRIPKSGDTAHWSNLTFKVEHMHRHRVKSVILTIGIYGT